MKILQADDHKLFREGVGSLLRSMDSEIEILQSEDYESTERMIDQHPDCDIVLLDLHMPGMNGLNGLRRLVTKFPSKPVIVLSASEHRLDVEYALKIGAAGFVSKSSPTDVLWSAIGLVMAGGIYSPLTSHSGLTGETSASPGHAHGLSQAGACVRSLTRRQLEILKAVATGASNSDIADLLNLSESTVKGHLNAILRILEVDNRVQAINRAYDLGMLPEHYARQSQH